MKHYINYIKYLLKHKFWVSYYCFKEGMYWQGLMHDINKFRLCSIKPYSHYFYLKNGKGKFVRDKSGYYDASRTGDDAFDIAWLHHQHTNKHHWQYWCMPTDNGVDKQPLCRVLDMPEKYINEMLCDWRGAGRAQGTNPTGGFEELRNYYATNKNNMYLTQSSRSYLEEQLDKHDIR